MPRASDGTYALPAGNPVATLSVISSTWANTTLSDISTALTGSLDRSGQGAMLAGLKLFDGVIGSPGLTWGTDTTSGLYRNSAADFRFSISAVDLLRLGTNLFQVSGTAPVFRINESGAAADNRLWDVIANGEDLNFRVLTDALVATNWLTIARTAGAIDLATLSAPLTVTGSITSSVAGTEAAPNVSMAVAGAPTLAWKQTNGAANNKNWFINVSAEVFQAYVGNDANSVFTNWLEVNRTGTTVDTVNFPNGTLQYGSLEVGYRHLNDNTQSGNYTIAVTDNGRAITYAGAGGHTYTIDTNTTNDMIFTVFNGGTGAFTIAGSGVTISWFGGTGAIPTGSRTLAVGGVCSIQKKSTNNARIWGTGLS